MALEYRLQQARATNDIDISASGDVGSMTDSLREAASIELNDYFAIRLGEVTQPVDEVATFRFSITVLYSSGRSFESIKIDVGFADPWLGSPQKLTARPLLDFVGIKPVTVRAIPIDQHLAEKIHAYTKPYGHHRSTRVKDLVDMVLLLDASRLNDQTQAEIIQKVFESRGTHPVPFELPPPPDTWKAPYAKLADGLPVPPSCVEAYELVETRLRNILSIAAISPRPRHA